MRACNQVEVKLVMESVAVDFIGQVLYVMVWGKLHRVNVWHKLGYLDV